MRVVAVALLVGPFVAGVTTAADEGPPNATTPAQVVIIPTIGNDHQFYLNYTVAHLAALLDTIEPDAIMVDDYTDWLQRNCPWNALLPEIHVALEYARERSVKIIGMRDSPTTTFEEAKNAEQAAAKNRDPKIISSQYRRRLDSMSARIARDYSFDAPKQDLSFLAVRRPDRELSEQLREIYAQDSRRLADQIIAKVRANPSHRRWAILWWKDRSHLVENSLIETNAVDVKPLGDYLPLGRDALASRMDFKHTAWILSGTLDEWYGMWAPQAFNGSQIGELLQKLKQLSPDDPATVFLEARWCLRNRDYDAAESLLKRLVALENDAGFPFPLNGKWIRPPWKSVRDKAKLNLAFVHDYKGKREQALALYGELLQKGSALNDDARALGYVYDDVHAVIQTYTTQPYDGMPQEAFRHFPSIAQRPNCIPGTKKAE